MAQRFIFPSQQIDRHYYQAELERHRIDQIVKIGLAFSGKRMAMAVSNEPPASSV